jgi:UDP-sulfoquinovose synthase
MQSAYDIPLTIYGTGGQTRAFIHIKNSVECVNIAVNNPPSIGDPVKIFNQMTETHNLMYLADIIKKVNPKTSIEFLENPRNELVKNELVVSNKQFLDLGLSPIYLDEYHIKEIFDSIKSNPDRVNMKFIKPMSFWKK